MTYVNFVFRDDVPDSRQEALLTEIRGWSEVSQAGRLHPDAQHPDIYRLCFASTSETATAETMRQRLQAISEIADASLAARRGLT